jgi:wyosine [tRNA(Phe)-imidazoG37] synthetase (radical SAM superfamily)
MPDPEPNTLSVFRDHRRDYGTFTYVYPVVSRRSRGLSIGINLNPDNACNFDCVYCCVDRSGPVDRGCAIDLQRLRQELRDMLGLAHSGELWRHRRFEQTPEPYRRLADIAFSGNGEPTACPSFPEAVEIAIRARQDLANEAHIVVITNATLLDRPRVAAALQRLDNHGGELWAKLDAGTAEYYQLVNRTRVPLNKVLDNLAQAGQQRELVIQTMLLNLMGRPMPEQEFDAYVDRVDDLLRAGCRIKAVHLYTIARDTAEHWVEPIDSAAMQSFAHQLRDRLPDLDVQTFV